MRKSIHDPKINNAYLAKEYFNGYKLPEFD